MAIVDAAIHPCAIIIKRKTIPAAYLISYVHGKPDDGKCARCGDPIPPDVIDFKPWTPPLEWKPRASA